MTKLLAAQVSVGWQSEATQNLGIPRWVSIRLKMASAVDGCLYSLLNVVPGRPSRYSNDRRDDADIVRAKERA